MGQERSDLVTEPRRRSAPPPIPPDACGPRPRRFTPTNRRAAVRRPLQLRVDVLPLLDQGGLPLVGAPRRGVSLDLSTDGLLCSRVGYLPVGSLVRLVLGLPDRRDNPLVCDARVVRCDVRRRPGYAFKLVGLGPAGSARLSRVLRPSAAAL